MNKFTYLWTTSVSQGTDLGDVAIFGRIMYDEKYLNIYYESLNHGASVRCVKKR